MKIPKYQSEGSLVAPQMRTPQLPSPLKLDQVVNEVESAYMDWEKEQDRAYKVYKVSEQQNTQLAIDQKYAEIKDRIDNGGSYAKAEKEFQKFYDKTVGQSLGRFSNDPLSAQEMSLDYRRAGAEYGMRLKSAVRSRAKRDAKESWNAGLGNLELRLLKAKTIEEAQLIMGDVASHYARGEGADLIPQGSGVTAIPKILDDTINNLIEEDPFAYMSLYENNREALEGIIKPGAKYKTAKIKAARVKNLADTEFTLGALAGDREMAQRFYSMQPTAEDLNGDNPFTRLQKKKNLQAAMPDTERDEKIREFRQELAGLKQAYWDRGGEIPVSMETEEGYAAGLKRIQDFRDRVNEAVEQGVFVGGHRTRSHNSILNDASEILQRYSAPLNPEEAPGLDWFTDPATQFKETTTKSIEERVSGLGLSGEDTFIAMTQMRDAVFARQGEVEGSRKEQAAKIEEIMADEFMNIINTQHPHLASIPQAQEAQRLLLEDGTDTKPAAKVEVPKEDLPSFDSEKDIPPGFKGKAYIGGRPAMIR